MPILSRARCGQRPEQQILSPALCTRAILYGPTRASGQAGRGRERNYDFAVMRVSGQNGQEA